MKILLIEDHVPVASVLRDALLEEGHSVVVAHSGEEGLQALAREYPDAVFLDVGLPGMNGVAVLRAIRDRDPDLPVIVLSGHATSADIDQLKGLGVQEVIRKPETLSRFTDALSRLSPQRPGTD